MTDLHDIRYDTMQLYVRPQADNRIASLIICTEPNEKKSNEETKNKKPRCSEETVSNKVRGVSPEAGRESMVGKVCDSGRS